MSVWLTKTSILSSKVILDKNANKKYKTWKLAKRARFEILQKKVTCPMYVVWAEESKTDLGFEIEPPQQKCQRKPTLQYSKNSAVFEMKPWFKTMLKF